MSYHESNPEVKTDNPIKYYSLKELAATQQAMKRYGGSFILKLADMMEVADHQNLRTIQAAWPKEMAKYLEMAKTDKDCLRILNYNPKP